MTTVVVRVEAGIVRIVLSAQATPNAIVAPRDPRDADAQQLAGQAKVELDGDLLTITAGHIRGRRRQPGLDVAVTAPEGSRVELVTEDAMTTVSGVLSSLQARTAVGDVHVESVTGDLEVRTAAGSVTAHAVGGRAAVRGGTGLVVVRHLKGTAMLATSSGDIDVWFAEGDVATSTQSGNAQVGVARDADVTLDASTTGGAVWPVPAATAGASGRALSVKSRSLTGDVRIIRADPVRSRTR